MPLMKKLGYPTLFCNELIVGADGMIEDFKMRVENSKLSTVKALQSIGFNTIALGDSFNDLGMIQAGKVGFLFRSTEQIKKDYPHIPAYEEYDELYAAIEAALQ
jgi:phosphoserine/homoserine phosphotransferase